MKQISQLSDKGLKTLISWLEKENISHPMKPDPQSSNEIVEKVNLVNLEEHLNGNKRRNSMEVVSARSQKVAESDFDLGNEVSKKISKIKMAEKIDKQDDSQKIAHQKKFQEEEENEGKYPHSLKHLIYNANS